jgi:prophage antirepressor-like protein
MLLQRETQATVKPHMTSCNLQQRNNHIVQVSPTKEAARRTARCCRIKSDAWHKYFKHFKFNLMSNVAIFEHPQFGKIHTELVNTEPWFCASDVCKALDFPSPEASLRKLDDDEKLMRKVFASGQNRDKWFVSESGLYNLIFRSNKTEAKTFRKWVTGEVLPAIRRNGFYGAQPRPMAYLVSSNKALASDFTNLMLRELLKVESRIVRTRMAGLIDFYTSQIQ